MFETISGQNLATIAGYAAAAILATMLLVKGFNRLQAASRRLNELAQWLAARKLAVMAEIVGYVASRDIGGATARTVELIRRIHEGGEKVLDDLLKPHWLDSLELRVQDPECVEKFEAALAAHKQAVQAKAKRALDAPDAATLVPGKVTPYPTPASVEGSSPAAGAATASGSAA